MVHAMMADHRSLDKPEGSGCGSFFTDQGWEVYLADLRGHGDSRPPDSNTSAWSYHDLVQLDIPSLVSFVRKRHPELKLCLFGQSLGGHISVAAHGAGFIEKPPEVYALLSTNLWQPSLENRLIRRAIKPLSLLVFEGISRVFGRFPSRALGLGTNDESLGYVRDLCGFWWNDFWGLKSKGLDYGAGIKDLDSPILFVTGKGDRWMADAKGAETWSRVFPPKLVESWRVGKGDFGLNFAPGHMELTTDVRSRPLWEALDKRLSEFLRLSPEGAPTPEGVDR